MPYKVGLRTLRYEDQARRNWEGTGARPLLTDVWYPAAEEARETDIFIGASDAPLFRVGRAARNAELLTGSFPLVLLSHGAGGSALQLGWLASSLARHGYIAAGVNHHGNTALEPFNSRGFLLWWERARDLSALADLLLRDSSLGPHVDAGRIGAAGFSLGGYTVIALAGGLFDLSALKAAHRNLEEDLIRDLPRDLPDRSTIFEFASKLLSSDTSHRESFRDPRVRCVLAISPALARGFTEAGLAPVEIPVEIIAGEADSITPPQTSAIGLARHIRRGGCTILDGGVAHYTFLGEGTEIGKQTHPDLCLDAPGVDRAAVHRRASEIAERFFDTHLGEG